MFAIAYISRYNLHCILLSVYLYYVLVFFLVPSLIIGYLHFSSLRMLSEKPEGRNGISSSAVEVNRYPNPPYPGSNCTLRSLLTSSRRPGPSQELVVVVVVYFMEN